MIVKTSDQPFYITVKRHRHHSIVITKKSNTEFLVKAHRSVNTKTIQYFFLDHLKSLNALPEPFDYDTYLSQEVLLFGREKLKAKGSIDSFKHQLKDHLMDAIHQLEIKYKSQQSLIDLDGLSYQIRYYKSKFGSCHPRQKIIRFNVILVHYDLKYLEYIYVHEIAHLKEPNHQRGFYALMDQLLPHHRGLEHALKNHHRTFIKDNV